MLIMPQKEIIVPARLQVELKGFLRLRTINKYSGKCRIDTGWFPNKLLTSGMNAMADLNFMSACQVGTNGTAPSASDTSLLGHHAGTSTITVTAEGRSSAVPYFGWKRKTFRFAAGTVAANLSEVGVGWGTSGSTLISRARILDPILQTPTTITPLADELLDVMYELRYYPPLTDILGPQLNLNGVIYNTTTRAASVTGDRWSTYIGSKLGVVAGVDWTAYDGSIGTLLTAPSGLSANCDSSSQSNQAYSNNSFQVGLLCNVGAGGWNLAGGIRSVRIRTTAGDYQTEFSAASGGATIPKDTGFTMLMYWTLSWGELPPIWVQPVLPEQEYSIGDRVTHNDVQWTSDIDDNASEPGIANWTLS